VAENPLKAVVRSLEEVDEAVHGLYDRQGDGTFALTVDGALPGYVEKVALDEFRESNIKLTEDSKKAAEALSKFDGVDLDKYQQWEKSESDLTRKNLIEAGQVEELIATELSKVSEPLKKQIKALESGIKDRDAMLSRKALDEEILKAANAAHARPGAEEFLIAKAKEQGWTTLDGKAVQLDGGGTPIYSDANPGSPKEVPEWVEEQTLSFSWAFASSSGGGATGSATTAPSGAGDMLRREDKKGFQDSLEDIASGKTKLKAS
tara:strand:- start:1000 stop:1788 length:789 start_codon:yes stop_codon:yes gene_type:complete